MQKKFSVYTVLLLTLLAVANHRGYVLTNFFAGSAKADKSANRYHK